MDWWFIIVMIFGAGVAAEIHVVKITRTLERIAAALEKEAKS